MVIHKILNIIIIVKIIRLHIFESLICEISSNIINVIFITYIK